MRNLIRLLCLWICLAFTAGISFAQPSLYEVQTGRIDFYSNAPKELIQARATTLKGIVDVAKKTFAFKIFMASFQGFNSPLQREHFNENYMETNIFPDASFSGKIIEEGDFTKDGNYEVRAKGKLSIHGIVQERIIKVTIAVRKQKMTISSEFTVLLADHGIKIPKVVYNKLAAEINVSLKSTLIPYL